MKIVNSVLKVIGIVIIILILLNSSYLYHQSTILFSKVPKGYKNYSKIGQLDSVFLNSNLNIKIFKSLYEEKIVNLNDSINYIRVNKLDNLTVSWYKIDTKGNVIDSLSFYDESIYDVNSYLLNIKKNYYLTWLQNGDTIKKPIKVINNGEIIKKEIATTYFDSIQFAKSEYVYESDSKEPMVKVIFYKDDNFYTCFTKKEARMPYQNFYHDNIINYTLFGEVLYYEKTDWRAPMHPNFNLYLNGRRPNHWEGYAYVNLKMFGETFKIKKYTKADADYNTSEMSGFYVYESPNKKYYVLRMLYHHDNTYYLITK